MSRPPKLHRSIRNTLWGDPGVDDRTDHSTANLEIRPRANMRGNKADAEGGVRRDAAVCGWAIENTAINSRCQAAVEVVKSPATETRCVGIEGEGAPLVGEPLNCSAPPCPKPKPALPQGMRAGSTEQFQARNKQAQTCQQGSWVASLVVSV
jgi:hypothetical protein